jgi:hypothetical protein
LAALRDEEAFRYAQAMHISLHNLEDEGKIQLRYFDESGLSLTPNVPYAWQPIGETLKMTSRRSKRLNVLGFMGRHNEGFFHVVEESVKTTHVVAAFDDFARHYATEYGQTQVPCLVILDNASIHRSTAFKAKMDDWMAQGVCLHYLPPYSLELNLIEILWRKIKYEWLPLSAYKNYASLKECVLSVLNNFGGKYTITFA